MFALAVLYVVLIIATEMMLAVAASFWLGSALADNSDGMRTIAIQTGGLGLILTMLIITGPPMAASFINGMLGQFSSYSQIGPGSATSNPATSNQARMSQTPGLPPPRVLGESSAGSRNILPPNTGYSSVAPEAVNLTKDGRV
jgi:type IV secretion system protein VirB6